MRADQPFRPDPAPTRVDRAVAGIVRAGFSPVGRRRWLRRAGWAGLLLAPVVAATGATNGVLNYTDRVWQSDDGLPRNPVWAITQTRDGYLWVGTRQGLARFDGVRFVAVDDARAPELKQGMITALCAGRDGELWIGCDGHGVIQLKEGKISRITETNGLPTNAVHCLLEARDGSLWIGSEEGLTHYREGKFTQFGLPEGLSDLSVRALFEDRDGSIQVATRRGLSTLRPNRSISTLNFESGWNANSLRAVWTDRQGTVWAASNDGLHRVRDGKISHYGVAAGLPDRVVNCILEDRTGQLWLGTYGGLVRMVDGRVLPRKNRQGVFGDLVHTLFEDREGTVWAGARDGLYQLKPVRFTTYTTDQGLGRNNVMSVLEDRTGTVWMATWGGGLSALRDDWIKTYTTADGLTQDAVLALLESRDGGLWIGMDFDGGVNRFNGAFTNPFPRPSGLINAPIRVLHEDRQGRLWIGTSAGLSLFAAGRFTNFTTNEGLAANTVLAIGEDDGGTLWFGTTNGLSRWDGKAFHNLTTREGLSHNVVDALRPDREQTLWIGTAGGGLNRLQAGRLTACTTRQGLFSDEIYEIVPDDFGFFWMSCRTGIFRVARTELEDALADRRPAVNCVVFGKVDGLLTVQCNGVAKPAGWKARDGRVWFPTIRGAVAVDTRIPSNDLPPPVVIEAVIADGHLIGGAPDLLPNGTIPPPAAATRPLVIPPGRGEVEIQYTALSLQAPEKNRFQYRLEGVDAAWRDAGTERTVRYNNLRPGNYRFRVTACNNDGVWNEDGTAIALALQPHLWQTWWFKLAGLAAVALVPVALYRLRVKRLRALEQLRIQIAADLHDDVGARLTKVAMVTEALDRTTPESDGSKPHIRNISQTTREIVQAMDEIVWTINPQNDTLENLASYLFQHAQDFFQHTGVRCRLDLPADLPELPLSTQQRHNLFMAVKEALNNVLKHAHAREVRLGLAVAGDRLTITVADDGCGFSPDQVDGSGNGLNNMRQRLERIGGRLTLDSRPGAGTRITLEAVAR
jgi:ligand-binding sensor domain-containing protein/signal transduction histidine kinase